MAEEEPKKKGPKGGKKHQPGRGHDRKSAKAKTNRFMRKAEAKRLRRDEQAKREWEQWEALSDGAKKFFDPPSMPKPCDEI